MGTETDLLNVVNRKKLQHFSHEMLKVIKVRPTLVGLWTP